MTTTREQLRIDPQKCTACNQCITACSTKHYGVNDPDYSRIKILRFDTRRLNVPVICMACSNSPCVSVCPMNARERQANGSLVTDTEKCIGCKACLYICPVGSPAYHPITGQTMTCDMCGDDPEGPRCVAACSEYGALTICDVTTQVNEIARKQVARMRRMFI